MGPPLVPPPIAPWIVTWALASGVIVAAKFALARNHESTAPAWWVWPGMDHERFHAERCAPTSWRELLTTLGYMGAGAILVWGVIPLRAADRATAWLGLLGLGLMLHFGVARLLSILWRWRGFDAQPLFDRPLASKSLAEFWGRRWNRAFHDIAHSWIYRPLRRPLGATGAVLAVFAASGIGHDAILSLPAGGGYGQCTAYFAIQAAGVLLERRRKSRTWTLLVVITPLPLLFHGAFLDAVVLPFLSALGATPR